MLPICRSVCHTVGRDLSSKGEYFVKIGNSFSVALRIDL